jgi:peptide/nickel transport system permease protein
VLKHPFTKFVGKKAIFYIIVAFIALTFVFLVPRLMPGNPIDRLIPPGTTDVARLRLKVELEKYFGLNMSLQDQYVAFWSNLLRGNLGIDRNFRPVGTVIMEKLPFTLVLVIPVLIIGFFVGNWIGARSAYIKGKRSQAVYFTTVFASQMPFYWFALVMVSLLAVDVSDIVKLVGLGILGGILVVLFLLTVVSGTAKLALGSIVGILVVVLFVLGVSEGVFPAQGTFSTRAIPGFNFASFADAARHYVLPFLTLLVITTGGWASGMRSMTLYELDAGYILYSKQLGFRDKKLASYARRNAILPQFTGLNINLNNLIGMTMIIEIVFRWDGIGLLAYDAVLARDYAMILGTFLVTMIIVILGNFLVDIAYAFLDPRIRTGREG